MPEANQKQNDVATAQRSGGCGCSALLADVVSYITDQSRQFRECAGHHAEHNPGAEAVAYRAAEILDRISADIKSANTAITGGGLLPPSGSSQG